jgi:hypothetical protein
VVRIGSPFVPRLLFLVLHDKSGQTVLAALYEKDAEKYGEEDALIKQARCQKNLEKRRKISLRWSVWEVDLALIRRHWQGRNETR